jgi:hypothetical protein
MFELQESVAESVSLRPMSDDRGFRDPRRLGNRVAVGGPIIDDRSTP